MEELIAEYGESLVIERLLPHLTEARVERIESVIDGRLDSLRIAVEEPADTHNALAIIRTAEAFGVSSIDAVNWPKKKSDGIGITRGTRNWTELSYHHTLSDFLEAKGNYKIAGACVEEGMPLHELPVDGPLILLFGNEHEGLTPEAREACDYRFTIPMSGMVESFNVSVAAGISLYDVTKRRRDFLGKSSDLTEHERLTRKAAYMIRAIGREVAKKIIAHYQNKC